MIITPLANFSITLTSSHLKYEYPLCYFVADLEKILSNQGPLAEEFKPFLKGAIDVIALFADQLDAEFRTKVKLLCVDFDQFYNNSGSLETVIEDLELVKAFPHLRFAHRITALENGLLLLSEKAAVDLQEMNYPERLYLYGVAKALSEIHEVLCNYLCSIYDNDDWHDYLQLEDIEQLCHDFLLNPTLFTQHQLQVGLAILAEKVRNL